MDFFHLQVKELEAGERRLCMGCRRICISDAHQGYHYTSGKDAQGRRGEGESENRKGSIPRVALEECVCEACAWSGAIARRKSSSMLVGLR